MERAAREGRVPVTHTQVCYLKKIACGGGRRGDVFVERAPCKHDHWQNAHRGEQAQRGALRFLQRLHGPGVELVDLRHCARCEGGGVWRVVWTLASDGKRQ